MSVETGAGGFGTLVFNDGVGSEVNDFSL